MNIFRFREGITSYRYPIWKIVFGVLAILLTINRGYFLQIDGFWQNLAVGVAAVAILCGAVLCICISFAEMLDLYERRSEAKTDPSVAAKRGKLYSIDEIAALAQEHDIVEIKVLHAQRLIKMGSASDNRRGSSVFFDKVYFLGDETFANVEAFRERLAALSADGTFLVTHIDHIPPKE